MFFVHFRSVQDVDRAKSVVIVLAVFGLTYVLSAVAGLMRGSADFATLLTFAGGSLIVGTSFWVIRQERYDDFAGYRERPAVFWLTVLATLAVVVGTVLQFGVL